MDLLFLFDTMTPKYWYEDGKAFYKLKKYDEAIKAYDKALDIDPENTTLTGEAISDAVHLTRI